MRKGRPNKPNSRKGKPRKSEEREETPEEPIDLLELVRWGTKAVLLTASVTVTRVGIFLLVGW